MRVGIIAEGKADQAVISNILRGRLGIDSESIQFIRPEDHADATDLHVQSEAEFGNCALVRKDCMERSKIREFFDSPIDEGERLLVIHVDTAEIGRADAVLTSNRPNDIEAAESQYADVLRSRVVSEINTWLENEFVAGIRYAVAVEETEAWVLALFVSYDTTEDNDPKKALHRFVNGQNGIPPKKRRKLYQMSEFDMHDELSRGFRRLRELDAAVRQNRSLALFVESL